MQFRLRLASSTFALVTAAAAAEACGHLPFDELPDDAASNADSSYSSSSSGGPLVDSSSGGVDARVLPDGKKPGDDDDDVIGADASPFDAEGPPDAACGLTGDCQVIYVSVLTGNDGNAGTSDKPVQTLAAALKLVSSTRYELHVATGNYPGRVVVGGAQKIVMLGGFLCNKDKCTWGPDAPENESIISSLPGDVGGALVVGADVGRETRIEKFHIKGTQGNVKANSVTGAITVSITGSPSFKEVFVEGGYAVSGSAKLERRSAAVLVAGLKAFPLFDACKIYGGQADGQAVGLLVEDGELPLPTAGRASVEVTNGTIVKGGNAAPSTIAVLLSSAGARTSLRDSSFYALPSSSNGVSSESESWAIVLEGTAEILRNRINAEPVTTSEYCKSPNAFCGGIAMNNAEALIQNNIIKGVTATYSAAVLFGTSDGKTVGSANLNGNYLDGGGHSPSAGTVSAAIVVKNTNATPSLVGSVRNDILLGGHGKTTYGVYEIEQNTAVGHLQACDHNDIVATHAYHYIGAVGTTPKEIDDVGEIAGAVTGATGNITSDCKVDTSYHLKEGSPCNGAGTSAGPAPLFDMDGDQRPIHPSYDIGPDESKFAGP